MNVPKLIEDFKILLESKANSLNLQIKTKNSNTPTNKGERNYIVKSTHSTHTSLYNVNHKEVDLLNAVFNINEENQEKLKKIAKIYNDLKDLSPLDYHFYQNTSCNHVTLKKFSMFDSRLGFSIFATDEGLSIWCEELQSIEPVVTNDFNEKADELINRFKIEIFKHFGFKEGVDENSPEYKDYIKNTKEVIHSIDENNFKYKLASTLIKEVCHEMKIDSKDIDGTLSLEHPNLKYIDKFTRSISIPYERKDFVKLMMDKICSEANVKNDTEQLINLMTFFQYISQNKFDIKIEFTALSKRKLSSKAYYTIKVDNIFSLCIGTKLFKIRHKSNDVFDELVPDTEWDSHCNKICKYAFYTKIGKENKDLVYYTNNLNYIYEKMRTIIRDEINEKTDNDDNPVGLKQIELYKMIMF